MGMKDLQTDNRRAYRRLELRLPLEYQPANTPRANMSHTSTVNVSTGGVYFETAADDIRPGQELSLELAVPAGDERFPPGGKITTIGQVVRTAVLPDGAKKGSPKKFDRYGVGVQFQQGLRLTF